MPEALVTRAEVAIENREYWISVILIIGAVTSFICAPIFGHLVNQTENIQRFYLLGLILLLTSTLLFTFADSLHLYIFAVVPQGASMSMVFVTGLSIMVGSTPKERMGYIFGYLHVFVATGLILGPLCGGIVYHYAGYYASFGVVLLLLAINLILCSAIIDRLTEAKWPNEPEIGHDSDVEDSDTLAYGSDGKTDASGEALNMWHLFREPRVMISATSILAYFLLIAALLNSLPIFVADRFQWGSLGAGCTLLPVTTTVILGPLLGSFSDRFSISARAALGFGLATPCFICLRFVQCNTIKHQLAFFVLLCLIGAFLNAVNPAITADMQNTLFELEERSPGTCDTNEAIGRIHSVHYMAQCVGLILGPVLGGLIDHRFGWGVMTIVLGAVTAATAVGFWLSGQRIKLFCKNDIAKEREPLLKRSAMQSSFATFDEESPGIIHYETFPETISSGKNSLKGNSASIPLGHRLVTAAERPDLWHPTHSDPSHGLFSFPQWSQGAVFKRYYRQLGEIEELARYQTMIVRNSDERVVATGVCTPFFWPELAKAPTASLYSHDTPECASTLPDGGWETILTRGVLQARARQGELPSDETLPLTGDQKKDEATAWLPNRPNAISGLLVVVADNYRGQRLAGILYQNFKYLARQNNLKALVIPVRPMHKSQYPHTPFEQYFSWIQEGPFRHGFTWPSSNKSDQPLPFDREIRKHIRMGAKAVKPAIRSFTVVASVAEWQQRFGDKVALDVFTDEDGSRWLLGGKLNGLLLKGENQTTPLRWDAKRQVGIYSETNMWMWHPL
ncbi:hypothetical protein N7481_001168 [Penicillium waksmanii]|uniref:uncharacterized protein n=1 Tax=Penicillium waksmanii TaxID=69791 RepID=UPI0025487B96|nr:uncharacterized protein N7481_001168 [Penicillium waksmanii]KAJ6000759.1 hypothetical protein N7481_001168 [Penicillium waksmanii]